MDSSSIFASVLGISAPSFFMGIIVAYIFGFVLSDYTGLNMTGSLYDTDPFDGQATPVQQFNSPRNYIRHQAIGNNYPTNTRCNAGRA